MPWKHNLKTLVVGREWVDDDGNKHPTVWARYTDAQKATFKIVWEDPPAREEPFDSRFYLGRQEDGTLIERSLADVNETDEKGNALLDDNGNQVVTIGLKTERIGKVKERAREKLAAHDWMVTRKTEKSTAIPTKVQTYRDAVRTKCGEIETSITNASNLKAFMALWDEPTDSKGNSTGRAPIDDWPDEI